MRRGTELRTSATASSERGARESGDEESIGGASGETEACPTPFVVVVSGDMKRFVFFLLLQRASSIKLPSDERRERRRKSAERAREANLDRRL